MGNEQCPTADAAHLANVARDFCPFPDYSPCPHFTTILSLNSSLHLKNHYAAVQSSLTPRQLEDFTQNLRTIFGRHGRVTHGGVGVVAFSLAFLFDAIARQVKGEWESQSEPIPGLFVKDLTGFYPPPVYTISKYLRLVPYIANNPTRMMKETERFLERLVAEEQTAAEDYNKLRKDDDIYVINSSRIRFFALGLHIHLMRISNGTKELPFGSLHFGGLHDSGRGNIFNLNCDVEAASEEFVAAMPSFDNHTQETFQRCNPMNRDKPVLVTIAFFNLLDIMFEQVHSIAGGIESLAAKSDDFDLKANALGTWK